MQTISKRLQNIKASQIVVMNQKGREMQDSGIDIINLSIGEPDFDTPAIIKQAGIDAINSNFSHYTPIAGFLDLRQAIAEKLRKSNHLDYNEMQVMVTTGSKLAIMNALMCLINKGDEVIIPTPAWLSYFDMVKVAEGTITTIKTTIETNYKMTVSQLEETITSKSKVLLLNSPSNPTGNLYSKAELTAIAEVIKKHPNIYVISDEVYEHLNYVGKHETIAQFDEIKDRVILSNGLSKGYAMTGWRVGYLAAAEWIIKGCTKLQTQFTSGACAIAQRAALTALTAEIPELEMMRTKFEKRRNISYQLLSEIPNLKTYLPQAAFYHLPDVSHFFGKTLHGTKINNAEDLSMYILEKGKVATVAGTDFGAPECIRISYATSDEKLIAAIQKMKKILN